MHAMPRARDTSRIVHMQYKPITGIALEVAGSLACRTHEWHDV